jgi:hypothetical protein
VVVFVLQVGDRGSPGLEEHTLTSLGAVLYPPGTAELTLCLQSLVQCRLPRIVIVQGIQQGRFETNRSSPSKTLLANDFMLFGTEVKLAMSRLVAAAGMGDFHHIFSDDDLVQCLGVVPLLFLNFAGSLRVGKRLAIEGRVEAVVCWEEEAPKELRVAMVRSADMIQPLHCV